VLPKYLKGTIEKVEFELGPAKLYNEFTSNVSPAQFAISEPALVWLKPKSKISNRTSKINLAGSRIRTDDLLITNCLVMLF